MEEVLLTAREAAAELGVHVGTVHNAFQESRLPFVALYGRKLISRAALDAYKRRTRPEGQKPKGRPRGSTTLRFTQQSAREMQDATK